MKQMMKQIGLALGILLWVGGATATAAETAKPVNSLVKKDAIQLINIAGKQRMLSQRIAKDYLYLGKNIAADKARKELKASLTEFRKNLKKIDVMVNDPEIKNLLAFVKMSLNELEATVQKPFSLDNAQLVLDLSESMLEGSQYVVDSLKKLANIKESKVVAISGKQRMLAQRIAKYYIAYQAGIKDKNTVDQMKAAVAEFDKNLKFLMHNKDNTATINQKLAKVESLWKIVYKFYLNIEKGGLPFIVYTTTNNITDEMDAVTKLYVELYK
ncbi:type IV pili methyl-accepting chemotaxis transducer N-terminal domain-containing protein [Nitratifractor sp.]|uniref:type IV pili methyl-accepting chemotaxis transducer N-terminal domain-containing protein n=1 Tax=Nitratifractor sp. TaxID=2268144 RepID=UPI0025FA315E|nr:type IV pili methyl-accepting chemotaxis transducer N-terminal domain-containing protein [Nitratifractor sp.]